MKKLLLIACLFMVSYANSQVKTKIKAKSTKPGTTVKKPLPPPPPAMPAGTRVKLTTDSGVMIIRLYDKTPLHRDNFVKLVEEKYYDSLLFHRVIREFMIQGGDPDSKNAPPGQTLGNGGPAYRIPAEFDTTLFHKKGALAAARMADQVNPKKESSGSQFYIVHGKKYSEAELNMLEMQRGMKIPSRQRLVYQMLGGTPFLDMNYTVFGEVESGLDVVDKIASVTKDGNNRPLQDLRMKMEIYKVPEADKSKTKIKTPTEKTKIKTSK